MSTRSYKNDAGFSVVEDDIRLNYRYRNRRCRRLRITSNTYKSHSKNFWSKQYFNYPASQF